MASLEEIRSERIKKHDALRARGVNPYPSRVPRTHALRVVREQFVSLEKESHVISCVGRVMAIRGQGAIQFIVLNDGTAELQAVLKRDEIGEEQMGFFGEVVDMGDFVSVTGVPFTTQRGEMSILVQSWVMASKSLLPLPDKWAGLQDEEEKMRKRYLDILTNPDLKELFIKKAKFWQAMRTFLMQEGFLEVETPVLEVTTGGADARPFASHHWALDIPVFNRISCGELWQKRLMVAGYPKTFEIGRIFRNEGMSPEHAQDYTQMECYAAWENFEEGMDFVERLYKYVAFEAFGKTEFEIRGFHIDLGKKWERYDYAEKIKEMTGIDITSATQKELDAKLHELKIKFDPKGWNRMRAIDNLWKWCRKQIAGPGFLINAPVEMAPLAKVAKDGKTVEMYQPIIAGSEVGRGYSELNDPLDQRRRFEEQQAMRDAGDEEAQMADWEFVEALEHGMPPTSGFGVSERLFSFLANMPIREAQLFPLVKPKGE
jgi:lysyl-tRNA synthetase, class II